MDIRGIWKVKEVRVPTPDGVKVFTPDNPPQEERFEGSAELMGYRTEFAEDGVLNTLMLVPEEMRQEAAKHGVEVREDGYAAIESTTWKEADGTEIDARGTNRFPKNYSSFVRELCKLITTERISSVHFSDGTYEITLPESWVGTVASSFSESQVAFFVDKLGGGELTFFIIDSDTYGYAPDSYKERIEVGRLISGEDVRFITARDNYAIASYAAEVSEEALGLWKNYESDKLSIVESLQGVNGYAFYPNAIAAKRQDLR